MVQQFTTLEKMQNWSLSSDFSFTCNPSSVWSYGSKPAGCHLTGMLSLFTRLVMEPDKREIVAWFGSDTRWGPHSLGVYYNIKPTNVSLDSNTKFIANGVAMHPDDNGSFSVVRFTAPKDGNYVLDVIFTHIEDCAQHSGVYITHNNVTTLWEIDLDGPEDSKSFKTTDSGILIRANEHIDFIVGVGLDNSFVCDMTLAQLNIHLLENQENQTEFPIIAGSIGFGFVLGYQLSVKLTN
ncbi:PEP-CTERM sorting domain-containing protein [Rhizophagus clarus]|uniref:PEP-CTERM sorting domain-containing protein n=1 Tax=Rhizophagus clarus TaxID=94130 RepID=A0A8H3QD90_9GLOM|nr:PEP-CTERM sorting domain-containing protein [Rhizophagus clarus]